MKSLVLFANGILLLSATFCGNPRIPQGHTLDVATELATEISYVAAGLKKISEKKQGFQWRMIANTLMIGSNLKLPRTQRIDELAEDLALMEGTFREDPTIQFSATYEINRIQKWAHNLRLLGLKPYNILLETVELPWKMETKWKAALNKDEKRDIILAAIKTAVEARRHNKIEREQ